MLTRYLRFSSLLLASIVLRTRPSVDALNASIDISGLRIERDIAYASGAMGAMDVYRPAWHPARSGAGKLPLLVFIHGGAWKSGGRSEYHFLGATLARAGVVVAIPDYRKTPDAFFPDFLEDNAQAVAFARAHAAEWGADPARLFLAGHSAGGYNALMLGLDPRYLAAHGMRLSDLAGVIGISAPADFLPSIDIDVIAAFGATPDPQLIQPIAYASANAPPILLMHGERDDIVGLHNAISLVRHMQHAGGKVRLRRFRWLGHLSIMAAIAPIFSWMAPVAREIRDFIRHPG